MKMHFLKSMQPQNAFYALELDIQKAPDKEITIGHGKQAV